MLSLLKEKRTQTYSSRPSFVRDDPFLRAWYLEIPKTTPNKVIYDFWRFENTWSPYEWGKLTFNPKAPKRVIEDAFELIKQKCKPHPLPYFMSFFLFFFFVILIPAAIICGIGFAVIIHSDNDENETKNYSLTCLIVLACLLVFMSVIRVIIFARYLKKLEARVKSLELLITDFNLTHSISRGVKFSVGNKGAWLEVEFVRPGLQMVEKQPGFGGEGFNQVGVRNGGYRRADGLGNSKVKVRRA